MKMQLTLIGLAVLALGFGLMFYGGRKNEGEVRGELYDPQNPAKVQIVEFADFQCPACAAADPIIQQILDEYDGQVSFEHRHFPLQSHANAIAAAKAAEAAREQGKFDEMKISLYASQSEWKDLPDPFAYFEQLAAQIGLDAEKFASDAASDKYLEKIQNQAREGVKLGITATPTFYLNGKKFVGVPGKDFLSFLEENIKNR